jgi:dolichol-phosphate mannosyltransferase
LKLSIVIPAQNEEGSVEQTLHDLLATLDAAAIPCEIVLVDDGSTDSTADRVRRLAGERSAVRLVQNHGPHGFGLAVRLGLEHASGDAVAVVMADGSDHPRDVVSCYRRMLEGGFDCVFGSRFIRGGKVVDYPAHKLVLNRLANWFIRIIFGVPFNDFTNAFKLYRRHVILGMQPLISPHFNLTVEMPLKAIVRGYSFGVLPITWSNRQAGISKLKIKEMGSRYLFIVLYMWLEKHLARGDYHRRHLPDAGNGHDTIEAPHA